MNRIIILIWLLVLGGRAAGAAPAATNSAASYRVLLIDASSMPVAAGQATLIIGELRRTNGVYTGEYRIKVFPYFYKNENGSLAIIVTDEALAGAARGKVAAITGKKLVDPVRGALEVNPQIQVAIEDFALCPRYSALVFENVTIQPSPLWLQYRLR